MKNLTSMLLSIFNLIGATFIVSNVNAHTYETANSQMTTPATCPTPIVEKSVTSQGLRDLYTWIEQQSPQELEEAYQACKVKGEDIFTQWAALYENLNSSLRAELNKDHQAYSIFQKEVGQTLNHIGIGTENKPYCEVEVYSTLVAKDDKLVGGFLDYRMQINNQRVGDFSGQPIESKGLEKAIHEVNQQGFDCLFLLP